MRPPAVVGSQFCGEDGVAGVVRFGGQFCGAGLPHEADVEKSGSWLPLSKPKKKIVGTIVTGPSQSVTDVCRL